MNGFRVNKKCKIIVLYIGNYITKKNKSMLQFREYNDDLNHDEVDDDQMGET